MIFILLYAFVAVWLARYNSRLIANGRKILHFWNGLAHLVASCAMGYFFGWQVGAANLCVTRVVFNTALNIYRGLPLDYVPVNPKSIVDKVEKYLFRGNAFIPIILYIFTAICLLINRL